MKKISPTSTKADLWEAYQDLLKQSTSATTTPSVPTESLRSSTGALTTAIDTIIKLNAGLDDVVTMLEGQRQKQANNEQEARTQLQQFHDELKRAKQELDYELKRTQKEKLDELEAELRTKRREYDDMTEGEKRALEQRKDSLKQQEDEFASLRKQVDAFPKQLEQAVKAAVDDARVEEQANAKVARDLSEKQVEGERAISKLRIETLEKTVKEQAEEVRSLKSQLERATTQVKDIAVSVIESKRPLAASPQSS